jgi:hypothetical protein
MASIAQPTNVADRSDVAPPSLGPAIPQALSNCAAALEESAFSANIVGRIFSAMMFLEFPQRQSC